MDRFLTADDLAKTLRQDVREGLTGTPKTLPPKWFYDERGSVLFEEITRLEEYYPTRREREILIARAPEIAAATHARTLLELGAGSGEKTRLLLEALDDTLRSYIPVDVSGDFLEEAAAGIAADHPDLSVRTVVADYEQHLHLLPVGERRLIAFLGGTIGNMLPAARIGFLSGLRATMGEGDFLLLGADLIKDTGRLVRAYDDAAGVTAEFNRNVLRAINRELDADFDVDSFEHVAFWNELDSWIEMRLRARGAQQVTIEGADLELELADGEEIRTEVSTKFTRERLEAELGGAGMKLEAFFTDDDGMFGLTLAKPA